MSYDVEVEMIREAKKLGLLTTPYCFNVEEAVKMAKAGADLIVGECTFCTERIRKLVLT